MLVHDWIQIIFSCFRCLTEEVNLPFPKDVKFPTLILFGGNSAPLSYILFKHDQCLFYDGIDNKFITKKVRFL